MKVFPGRYVTDLAIVTLSPRAAAFRCRSSAIGRGTSLAAPPTIDPLQSNHRKINLRKALTLAKQAVH